MGRPAIPRTPRPRNRDGIALVLTLGLMAMLAILVVGFTLTVRQDRLSARNYRDQVSARQYATIALEEATRYIDLALGPEPDESPLYGGRTSPFGFDGEDSFGYWFPSSPKAVLQQTANVMGSPSGAPPPTGFPGTKTRLFSGAATNLAPAALWEEAADVWSYWTYIVATNYHAGSAGLVSTNGRVAFLTLDVSGFPDAHHVNSNLLAHLPEYRGYSDSGPPLWNFIEDYRHDLDQQAPFFTLGELAALVAAPDNPDRSLNPPIAHLFTVSCDPNPEVWVRDAPAPGRAFYPSAEAENQWWELGSRAIGEKLEPRFNLNDLTNFLAGAGSALDRYQAGEFMTEYFASLAGHLAAAGYDESESRQTAWNIVNALDDHDFIPRSDSDTPWRENYAVKPCPLINEFVLFEVPSYQHDIPPDVPADPTGIAGITGLSADSTNHYALAVELWYPFVPHELEENQAQLVVGVFTDQAQATAFQEAAPSDVEDNLGNLGFIEDLPAMAFNSPAEFFVTHSEKYVNFPVEINQFDRRFDGENFFWEEDDPKTEYLPIGATNYRQRVLSPDRQRIETVEVQLDQPARVWFQARVRMRDRAGNWQWVDEAWVDFAAHPVEETASWRVNDPRRNAEKEDWGDGNDPRRNAEKEDWGDGSVGVGSATLGQRNDISTVADDPRSAGLPIYVPNAPLDRIGDLGAISLGGDGNDWRTIDLTEPRGAHLLDRLTITPGGPAYGRIHAGTRQPAVIRALLADITIGWHNQHQDTRRSLDDGERERLSEIWFEAQQEDGLGLRFAELFAIFGERLMTEDWLNDSDFLESATRRDIKEQVLRGLVDHLSFRQNIFIIIGAGQALSPARRVVGEHRMAAIVLRDAYTGRRQVLRTFHLPD